MNVLPLYRLRLADAIAAGDTTPMMVFPIGEWHSTKYPSLPLTEDLASELIANFESGLLGTEPVVDSSGKHDTSAPAAGWVKRVYLASYEEGDVTGLALWADVKWTTLGAELLTSEQYKYGSVEIGPVVLNDTGETVDNVLRSLTLTNTPVLRLMPNVQNAAEKQRAVVTLSLSEVTLSTTTEDPGDHAEPIDGSSDAASQFAKADEGQDVALADGDAVPKGVDSKMNPKTIKTLKLSEGADDVAIDAAVMALAEDRDAEKVRADAAEKTLAEVEKAKRDAEIEATLTELVDGGHVLPGQKEAWTKLAEDSPESFAVFAVSAKKVKAIELGEVGTSEGGESSTDDPTVELDNRAKKLAEDRGIPYGDAMNLALAEDPALAARYHNRDT